MKEQYHSNWNSMDNYAKNKIVFFILFVSPLIIYSKFSHSSHSHIFLSVCLSLSLSLSLSLTHTHTHTQAVDLHHSDLHPQLISPSANLTIVSTLPKATHHNGGFVLKDSLHSHFSPMVVIGGSTLVFGCQGLYIGFIGGGPSGDRFCRSFDGLWVVGFCGLLVFPVG